MRGYLGSLPAQILEGYGLGKRFKVPSSYKGVQQILFCGVGGSAIGGDVLAQLMAARGRLPFQVSREASLPAWADNSTLVILSSYSGNTRETRAALSAALRKKSRLLLITSGGHFERVASTKNIPCVIVPPGLPPRCAIGYLTLPLASIMSEAGWLNLTLAEVREAARAVEEVSLANHPCMIARELKDRQVFLYGASRPLSPVLTRWRAQLAENAKVIASHHVLPEMFHNEIEGWTLSKRFTKRAVAVFIMEGSVRSGGEKKIKMARKFIREHGADVLTVQAPSGRLLTQMFSLIALGDWVSYELARLYGVDPVPIPVITAIKNAPAV